MAKTTHCMTHCDGTFWTGGERARSLRVEQACNCGHCNRPTGVTHWLTGSNSAGVGFNLPLHGPIYARHVAQALDIPYPEDK